MYFKHAYLFLKFFDAYLFLKILIKNCMHT